MVKRLIQIFLIFIFIFVLFCIYLSIYGVSTNKFNDLVNKKITEKNQFISLEIDKIKIFLNFKNKNLELKTKNPKILFKQKNIKIKSISTELPLKSIFQKQNNLNNITVITEKNKIQNFLEIAKSFKFTTRLFVLENMIKSGHITAEIKMNLDQEGKILNDYMFFGKIEDANFSLLNKSEINKINFNYLIQDKNFLFYNSSLVFQNINFTSNEIRAKDNGKNYFIEGDVSTDKSTLKINKLIKHLNFKNYLQQDNVDLSSSNKFSFKLNKKLKFSNLKIQSNLEVGNLEYSNLILKKFLPSLKDKILVQENKFKVEIENSNIKILGKSKVNINNDIDDVSFSINKNNDKILFKSSIDIKQNAINFQNLNYTKRKDLNSTLNIDGIIYVNKFTTINKIKFKEGPNIIELDEIKINNNKKITSLDKLNIYIINDNQQLSELIIKRNKKDYLIRSKVFDATKLLDKILFSKGENNFLQNFEKLNSSIGIKIDNIYLSKNDFLINLNSRVKINNSEISNLILSSEFPNKEKLNLSIVKNVNDEMITTLTTKNAKPLVKKYKFIKGFENGSLDFYSISKHGFSKSNLIINNFKLNDVPALTKLLTLASLQGIADLLTGEGIRFSEFEMKYTNNKGLVTIDEIYSIGPSISILMDGFIQRDNLVSLRGTLVPATTINKVIGSIPVLGDILVGKRVGEGVFGVSFKIKGLPKDLKTTVNPIKTLTPRFITRTLENLKKSN